MCGVGIIGQCVDPQPVVQLIAQTAETESVGAARLRDLAAPLRPESAVKQVAFALYFGGCQSVMLTRLLPPIWCSPGRMPKKVKFRQVYGGSATDKIAEEIV